MDWNFLGGVVFGALFCIVLCLSWFVRKGYTAVGAPVDISDIFKPGDTVNVLGHFYCGRTRYFLIEGPPSKLGGRKRVVRIPDLANFDEITPDILEVRPGLYCYGVTRSVDMASKSITVEERLVWIGPCNKSVEPDTGSIFDESLETPPVGSLRRHSLFNLTGRRREA